MAEATARLSYLSADNKDLLTTASSRQYSRKDAQLAFEPSSQPTVSGDGNGTFHVETTFPALPPMRSGFENHPGGTGGQVDLPSSSDSNPSNSTGETRRRPAAKYTGETFCTCQASNAETGFAGSADATCKSTPKERTVQGARRAVQAVCKMKDKIQDLRKRFLCEQRVIREELQQGTTEAMNKVECSQVNAAALRRGKKNLKPEQLLKISQRRLTITEALAAVASIGATKSLLWVPNSASELFYTRSNMWRLRKDHTDPFTVATSQFLPSEMPRLRMPHCAIVGNSGILKRHKPPLGSKIDKSTVVVRINQGPATEAYHEYVGSKTHVRVLNRRWTQLYATKHKSLLQKSDAGNLIIASRAQTRFFERLGEEITSNATGKMLLLANHNLVGHGLRLLRSFRNGLQEALGLQFKGGDSPSSGFLAILLMMQVCTKTSIYGFSLGGCSKGCGSYHYFNDVPDNPRRSAYKGHTYINEGWLLKALHVMGLACLEPAPSSLGPCGSRFGQRLRLSGAPKNAWGGDQWTSVGRLVADISSGSAKGRALDHRSRGGEAVAASAAGRKQEKNRGADVRRTRRRNGTIMDAPAPIAEARQQWSIAVHPPEVARSAEGIWEA